MMTLNASEHYKVLAISGSLRENSFNSWLVENAVRIAPSHMTIEVYEGMGLLPLYNPDLDDGRFDAVTDLRSRIRAVDGLLLSTPEYNHGISGSLKNLLDWASRPSVGNVLHHKPIAIAGVASGHSGTIRAQGQLREILLNRDSDVVTKPELHVFLGAERFDESGHLKDEVTTRFLFELLDALAQRIRINRLEFGDSRVAPNP
jgi:chromate reductase